MGGLPGQFPLLLLLLVHIEGRLLDKLYRASLELLFIWEFQKKNTLAWHMTKTSGASGKLSRGSRTRQHLQ